MEQLYLLLNFTSDYCFSMDFLTYCNTVIGVSCLPRCWPKPLRFKCKIDKKLQKLQSLSFDVKIFCNVDKNLISNEG